MKRLIFTAAMIAISVPAYAQCPSGTSTAITLQSWTAEPGDSAGSTTLAITLRNDMKSGFRLVDGTVWFRDVLGGSIGGVTIDRSSTAEPGATFEQFRTLFGMSDLAALNPDDIIATACTEAVVLTDGTVVENPRGAGPAEPFSADTMAAFADAVRRCWNPPLSTMIAAEINGSTLQATIRAEMNPNGSVAATSVIAADDEALGLSAQRAVQQCGPYSLPEAAYENWHTIDLTLDTAEF